MISTMRRYLQSPWVKGLLAVCKLFLVPVAIGWVALQLLADSPAIDVKLNAAWLLLAVILIEVVLLLVSWRLVQVLAIYKAHLVLWSALRINLQSLFYFLVVPTQAGMEAARFIGVRNSVPKASNAAITTTLLLDRAFGALAAGLLFAAAALLIIPDKLGAFLDGPKSWGWLLAALAAISALALGVLHLGRRSRLLASLMTPVIQSWPQLIRIMAYAVLAQALVALTVYCALQGLGLDAPLASLIFGIMGGTILMAIPISFAGLGPAELGAAALLLLAGVPEPTAIFAVFLTYLTRVFGGLQGGAIELWRGGRDLKGAVTLTARKRTSERWASAATGTPAATLPPTALGTSRAASQSGPVVRPKPQTPQTDF
jgi:uncharacterized membrane protein YbhN (UPF0104 family)